ncbi:polysaccharide pyruvyl transferase family protein [Amycolatopsis sp. NPDC006131]|uniref:polysaccharide pyruvyl transferase family protein n=1 Tax=Amycolatopsis sp. NPDC006131 TaxID=3156731 RepID=UPI0033A79185
MAAAGWPNFGDELIATGWLRYLTEAAPDADVWVDTHCPGSAAVLLSAEHPRVHFTDTLWRLCRDAPSDEPWEVAAWVRDVVQSPSRATRYSHGLELLSRADLVHLIGGGYINTMWSRQVGLLAGVVAAAGRSGARTAMTGQGIAPVSPHCEPLVQAFADRFDVVDVRDAVSARILNVEPGVDDAFLTLGPQLFRIGPAPEFMVCLQSDLVEAGTSRLAAIALATLKHWKVPQERLGFAEAIPGQDGQVYELLRHEFPAARFFPFDEVWAAGLPAFPSQVWLTSRFHVHLLAAAAGARGVAISVHPDYYSVKHRSLAALGSGWTVHDDLGGVPDLPETAGFDPRVVERYRAAKRDLARSLYGRGSPAASPGGPAAPVQPSPNSNSAAKAAR